MKNDKNHAVPVGAAPCPDDGSCTFCGSIPATPVDLCNGCRDNARVLFPAGAAPPAASAQPASNLLRRAKDIVKCIREMQCGDYSPIMDELLDLEHEIREVEKGSGTPATPSAPDADTRFDQSIIKLAFDLHGCSENEIRARLRRRLLPMLQAINAVVYGGTLIDLKKLRDILEDVWLQKS